MPKLDENPQNELVQQVQKLQVELGLEKIQSEYLQETLTQAVRAYLELDNVGWDLIGNDKDIQEGFDRDQLLQVAGQLSEWTDTNPLLWNGWDKRCSFLFGSGYSIGTVGTETKISARVQALIDSPLNQHALFNQEALRINERSRYTEGAVFLLFDKDKKTFKRVPLRRIVDCVTDPDDPEIIWYYKVQYERKVTNMRTGERKNELVKVWYRTDTALDMGAPVLSKIDDALVDDSKLMVHDIVGKHAGNTWGVPDAFAAAPWALAYSAYLRDGTKVLASLASWTWQLSPKTKNGGDKAGATIKTHGSSDDAGSTVVTDMDLNSLPRGNAVDLNTGRPLAAQAAAALGISVVILLSDPGQSGAYGTAQTLTDPSLRTLMARQDVNSSFLCRCLQLLGVKNPQINWEKISPDADYREAQILNGALGTGLFYADEMREPIARVANITLTHDKAPDGFMLPNNSKSLPRKDIDTDKAGGEIKPDGTTKMTNGQGAANTAKPSYGNNDLRGSGGRSD